MGWTLGRYFFRRHAVITAWALAAAYVLVFLVDFSEFARRVSALPGYTLSLGLMASVWRVPFVLLQVLPFLSLFSAIITLVSLNRRYELVVVRSAGISAWQFLMPLCAGAFLLGVLAVGTLALTGHAYGAERMYTLPRLTGISPATRQAPSATTWASETAPIARNESRVCQESATSPSFTYAAR